MSLAEPVLLMVLLTVSSFSRKLLCMFSSDLAFAAAAYFNFRLKALNKFVDGLPWKSEYFIAEFRFARNLTDKVCDLRRFVFGKEHF